MGMIVTLYLISANVYNSVEAPKARNFSLIEIWMLGTQFPILLALFEYGIILHLKKLSNMTNTVYQKGIKDDSSPKVKKKQKATWIQTNLTDTKMDQNYHDYSKLDLDDKIKKIDYVTMMFSFLYFSIFSITYWIVGIH